jgi:hypothetical protein
MKLALLLLLVACQATTAPAYFVGDASFAVVVMPGSDTVGFYRVGEAVHVSLPGDSVCVHFHADGNMQTIVLWSQTWPRIDVHWIPHAVARHTTLRFAGAFRETSWGPVPC